MLEACRTCLGLIDVDESPYYEIEDDEVKLSTESCRYKLLSIVPKMALDITPKSILCAECHGSLEALFEFKEKCLKTENIITRYFQAKPGIKNFDLKDVSDFNTNNVRIIKDDDVETSFEDEVELSGSMITNVMYEMDDFSSVKVAQPKNAVPASSDDIDVIEDETFKEEVELSETVVTNVKDEVDLTKIASVAKNTINVVPANKNDIDVNKDKNIQVSVEDDAFKEKVECEICERRYRTKSYLKVHMKIHTVEKLEKRFRCEKCNENFWRKYQLTEHLRSHKGLPPYVCVVCNKVYCSEMALGVHRRYCGFDTRPFKCAICSKGFKIKSGLISHLRRTHTHTGERPY